VQGALRPLVANRRSAAPEVPGPSVEEVRGECEAAYRAGLIMLAAAADLDSQRRSAPRIALKGVVQPFGFPNPEKCALAVMPGPEAQPEA
jgi:hypothetical protein